MKFSHVILLVDTSYSVNDIIEPYVNSVNKIIEMQSLLNPQTSYSVATFNDVVKFLTINERLADTKRIFTKDDLAPENATALYDNIPYILIQIKKFFKANRTQDNTLVIILTDGNDTSSRKFGKQHVALEIARCKAEGWKFVYVGVDEDSLKLGKEVGCDLTILYDKNKSEQHLKALPILLERLFVDSLTNEFSKLFKERQQHQIDMRELENVFNKMKV
jgi:hypothetical protein